MALDWSKEIKFSGLRRPAPKQKNVYPTKTYMNLAVADRKTVDMRKRIPAIVVLVVVVALFLKFGVFDFIGATQAKQAELASRQQELALLESQLVGYDDVAAEYSTYASTKLSSEGSTVSSLDALALVDTVVRPIATVSSLNYESNELTLTIANASLGSLGELMSVLDQQPIVENVSIGNTGSGQSSSGNALTAMTITLHKAGDEQ